MTRGKDYPIVYAIMGISDYTDWDVEETIGYIVSPAYLVNERIIYNGDGTKNEKYEIVFPYHSILDIKDNKRHLPEYGIGKYDECYNSKMVDSIYDDLEKASSVADTLNKRLLGHFLATYPFTRMQETKEEFNDRLKKCKLLEEYIKNETSDMYVVTLREKVKTKIKE